jgi:hypothetical protein
MLKLVAAIVCESASELPPYTLVGVRKRWASPPNEICVYLEVFNFTGDPYEATARIRRRSVEVASFESELVLMTRRDRDEIILALPLDDFEPKSYSIDVLLDGVVADTIWVDFGHTKAAP